MRNGVTSSVGPALPGAAASLEAANAASSTEAVVSAVAQETAPSDPVAAGEELRQEALPLETPRPPDASRYFQPPDAPARPGEMLVVQVERDTPPIKDFDAFPSTTFRYDFEVAPGRCRPGATHLFKDRVNFDRYTAKETGFVLVRDKENGKMYLFGVDVIHSIHRTPDYSSHDATDKFLALMFGGMDRIKDRFEKLNQGFVVPMGRSERDPEAGIVYQITELRGTTTYGSQMGHHVAVTPDAQLVKSAFQQVLGIHVLLPDRDTLNIGGEAVYNFAPPSPWDMAPRKGARNIPPPPRPRGQYEGD